jgi:hypothetical protein
VTSCRSGSSYNLHWTDLADLILVSSLWVSSHFTHSHFYHQVIMSIMLSFGGSSANGAWDDRELVSAYDTAMEEFHVSQSPQVTRAAHS